MINKNKQAADQTCKIN